MIIRAASLDDLVAISAIQADAAGAAQWDPEWYFQHDCLVADVGQDSILRPVGNRSDSGGRLTTGRRLPTCLTSVVGFLVTRRTAPGEREILNLAVDAQHRRQGIARALLKHALDRAHADWYLEVRQSNAAAIGLYHSLGFEQVVLRPGYYSEPAESGIVMKLRS